MKIIQLAKVILIKAKHFVFRKKMVESDNSAENHIDRIYKEEKLLSLEERKKIIKNAKGKKIVVYYADSDKSAPFRYRCFNTTEATLKSKKWQSVYFLKSELDVLRKSLSNIDLLIIERQSSKDKAVIELVKEAKIKNITTLFDIDDLVFSLKYLRVVMKSVGSLNFSFWGGYIYSLRKIAKKADGFITTNDFIGKKITKSFKKPYKVISNSLNMDQVKTAKVIKKKKNDNFIIGYFSGSPTHKNDLELASAGIAKFLNEHKDARLRIVGFMELPELLRDKKYKKQIEILPPVPYVELQRLIADVDVNIAPLVENDFTNCKSELKFFEAAIVKTITIASPTYAFKNSIDDGKTGFLSGSDEWYQKLEYVYSNQEGCKKIVEAANKYCLDRYSGEKFLKEIESAYDYFSA